MRKILTLSTLAGLLFVAGAQAQQFGATTLISDAYVNTNGTTVAVTTNGTAVMGVSKFDQVWLEADFKLMSAGTSGDNATLSWYLGGTSSATTVGPGLGSATLTQNGVTTVRWATNLSVGSAGYLKVMYSGTTNVATTNLNVKVYTKPRRTG